MNTTARIPQVAASRSFRKTPRCVECAGIGERDPRQCTHDKHLPNGRSAVRAIFDDNGLWHVHWREKDGEEWAGTYRLIPC